MSTLKMGGKGDLSFPLRSYLWVRLLSRSNLVFCRGVEILGPSESRDPAQRRVKFADGVVDDWDVADFREKHIGGAILQSLPTTIIGSSFFHSDVVCSRWRYVVSTSTD